MERIKDSLKGFPLLATGLAFLAGLLLGWLAIGWWLWPVSWTDADPWDLRAEHQQRYVLLAAREYARSKSLALAGEALAGWNRQELSALMSTFQDQVADPGTRQQLDDLASALELPKGEAGQPQAPEPAAPIPPLTSRMATVCGAAVAMLVVFVLIIFAVSTRPWTSLPIWTRWAQPAQRPRTAEAHELNTGHFTCTYIYGQDDYDDYFSIETPDGRFLGECGLSVGRILGRELPHRVTALEMVLFDSQDHRTETRILMSRYAYEDAELRRELVTRGELMLAEPGAQVLVETDNLEMSATVVEVEYVDRDPAEGVFQHVAVDLDVRIKHLPQEVREAPPEGAEAGPGDMP